MTVVWWSGTWCRNQQLSTTGVLQTQTDPFPTRSMAWMECRVAVEVLVSAMVGALGRPCTSALADQYLCWCSTSTLCLLPAALSSLEHYAIQNIQRHVSRTTRYIGQSSHRLSTTNRKHSDGIQRNWYRMQRHCRYQLFLWRARMEKHKVLCGRRTRRCDPRSVNMWGITSSRCIASWATMYLSHRRSTTSGTSCSNIHNNLTGLASCRRHTN